MSFLIESYKEKETPVVVDNKSLYESTMELMEAERELHNAEVQLLVTEHRVITEGEDASKTDGAKKGFVSTIKAWISKVLGWVSKFFGYIKDKAIALYTKIKEFVKKLRTKGGNVKVKANPIEKANEVAKVTKEVLAIANQTLSTVDRPSENNTKIEEIKAVSAKIEEIKASDSKQPEAIVMPAEKAAAAIEKATGILEMSRRELFVFKDKVNKKLLELNQKLDLMVRASAKQAASETGIGDVTVSTINKTRSSITALTSLLTKISTLINGKTAEMISGALDAGKNLSDK